MDGNTEERPRREALEIALAADLEVVKEYALRWNPVIKPQVEAHHSSAVVGVGGAVSV